MIVPLVDENLYVRTARGRNIPYDVRHKQPNGQNNTGQKPNIPPWQSSLQTNCTVSTTDITTKLHVYDI